MKHLTILITLVLLFSCAHYKPDPWTKNQIALQSFAIGLKAIDWGTTLDLVGRPNYYEMNPILGKYPSRAEINTYFACSALSQILLTHLLPSGSRKWWLGFNIFISGYCVNNNYGVGLRVNF